MPKTTAAMTTHVSGLIYLVALNGIAAAEIMARLKDREHLILLSMAEDDDGVLIPVAYKIGHELRVQETSIQLAELYHAENDGRDDRKRLRETGDRGKIHGSWNGFNPDAAASD